MLPTAVMDSLAVGVSDAQALKAKAASGDPEALKAAARQFEAMMVAQLLKGMRETHFISQEDDPFGGQSLKLYQELLDQQWAARISQGRGLGYAEMLTKALQKQVQNAGAAQPGGPVPDKAGADPVAVVSGADAVNHPTTAPVDTSGKPNLKDYKRSFIDRLRPQAEAAAQTTGLPADFILAHAALESGWGSREIRSADGHTSHNLFGIKAGSNWQGESATAATTEYRQGKAVRANQGFRSYDDYGQAFDDYARLLGSRYAPAVNAGKDAHAFTQALAAGGYATDPAYSKKLQAVIASVARMSS